MDPGTGILNSDLSLLLIVVSQPASITYSPPHRQNNNSISYLTGVLGAWSELEHITSVSMAHTKAMRLRHVITLLTERQERGEERESERESYLCSMDLAKS